MRVSSRFTVVAVFALLTPLAQTRTPCGTLTTCAVQKCIDKETLRQLIATSSKTDLFGAVVEKFDMVCIAAKCTEECKSCKQCQYAIEQMSALASGEDTSGLCPKLEGCVQTCLAAGELPKIISCVADRCNVHCYDGDCPSCRAMSKRLFTIICQQTGMTSLPQINYDGTCPRLFSDMADEYVAMKRRVAV